MKEGGSESSQMCTRSQPTSARTAGPAPHSGGHWPQVAAGHCKWAKCGEGREFEILLSFNQFTFNLETEAVTLFFCENSLIVSVGSHFSLTVENLMSKLKLL